MALKSIRQAAETWAVSVCTVRRLAAAGLVRTVTVGRRRLVSDSEIERIVATGVPRLSAISPQFGRRHGKTSRRGGRNE
jgi:excisionase family DNA binding protein